METTYNILSAVLTGLSVAGLLYGAWLSLRFGLWFGNDRDGSPEKHA